MSAVFQIGETYYARSIGDSDCVFTWTVTARTARFVTFTVFGEERRVGVSTENPYVEGEVAYPLGRYSMAPMARADRVMPEDETGACVMPDGSHAWIAQTRLTGGSR